MNLNSALCLFLLEKILFRKRKNNKQHSIEMRFYERTFVYRSYGRARNEFYEFV